jgi:hypothetical protein
VCCTSAVCVVHYCVCVTYGGYDDGSAGHAVSHHVHVAVVAASNVSCLGEHAADRTKEEKIRGKDRGEGNKGEKG